jgi:hypothetical protein
LALLAGLLLLPSANLHRFDGLPLSSLPEAVALALGVPVLASAGLRRLLGRALGVLPAAGRRALWIVGLAALGGKVLLFLAGTHAGFLACYTTPLDPPPAGPCERAFENPFFRFGVTRLDRVLDFGPDDWNLSFVNSNRFNFYHWQPGRPRRDRLPLAVTWTGALEARRAREVLVAYVGEGAVQVGAERRVELPRHYGAPREVRFTLPAGRHAVRIDYAFDDGSRTGDGRRHGAYATFRLRRGDGAVALRPPRPGGPWRALGAGIDVAVLAWAVPLLVLYGRLLWRERWVAAAAVGVGVLGPLPHPAPAWLQPALWMTPLLGLVLLRALGRGRRRALLLAWLVCAALCATASVWTYGRLGRVAIRGAGQDWLTYESLARSILETWSLEGGEPVFAYQPLFRYFRFAERLLLGDGDPLVLAAGLTGLTWSVLWAAARLAPRGRSRRPWRLASGLVATLLLVLALSRPVVRLVAASASEHPTWVLLPLVVPALLAARSPRGAVAGTMGLGAGFLFRTNHLPAVLGLFAAFALRAVRRHPRRLLVAGLLLAACLALPAVHNAYYGGVWVPLTRMATIPQTLVLPPARLVREWDERATWRMVASQLRGVLALAPDLDPALAVSLHGLQLAWLGAGMLVLWGRRGDGALRLALLAPLLYLGVHVFYKVWTYYPRHVLAGHVAMGVVTLLALRALAGGGSPGWRADGSPAGPPPAAADRRAAG